MQQIDLVLKSILPVLQNDPFLTIFLTTMGVILYALYVLLNVIREIADIAKDRNNTNKPSCNKRGSKQD